MAGMLHCRGEVAHEGLAQRGGQGTRRGEMSSTVRLGSAASFCAITSGRAPARDAPRGASLRLLPGASSSVRLQVASASRPSWIDSNESRRTGLPRSGPAPSGTDSVPNWYLLMRLCEGIEDWRAGRGRLFPTSIRNRCVHYHCDSIATFIA